MARIVIGIDGGGTHTRVAAADLSGRILATAMGGAASPNKTIHARENVQNAIREAVARAGCGLDEVAGLVAGIAGLDSPNDQQWAETFTDLPGLACSRLHVNDAVVAHAGALRSQPGIIAISGTGSIVFGVTEQGRCIRNYDFCHYAHSGAQHLSYQVMYRMLAGMAGPDDSALQDEVLAFWQCNDIAELRERSAVGFLPDGFERTRVLGRMAPLVTQAARNGVPLARAVCDAAARELEIGIRLVGGCFAQDAVQVALIGGVVHSAYMRQAVESALAQDVRKQFQIVEAAYPSESGAVLMALARQGVIINEAVLCALGQAEQRQPATDVHNG